MDVLKNIDFELEKQILGIVQDGFPLENRPYLKLAELLGTDEKTVFDAVENMRHTGVIRRIGGVYDSKRLGFISRLCAGKVNDVEKFAMAVNNISSITHNYIRSHSYNVWFTVIAENECRIGEIVDKLCAETDLHDVHVLSATKKYKINTVMGVEKKPDRISEGVGDSIVLTANQSVLTLSDKKRIHIACADIPHTLMPFADWGVSIEELQEDLALKRMRRFGAILRHQQAGFAYNAMVCFKLDEKEQRNVGCGEVLARNPHVSHCYERPAFEGFPYRLYAMMHAQTSEDLDCYIKEAALSIGNPDHVVLHSLNELKKTSFTFF